MFCCFLLNRLLWSNSVYSVHVFSSRCNGYCFCNCLYHTVYVVFNENSFVWCWNPFFFSHATEMWNQFRLIEGCCELSKPMILITMTMIRIRKTQYEICLFDILLQHEIRVTNCHWQHITSMWTGWIRDERRRFPIAHNVRLKNTKLRQASVKSRALLTNHLNEKKNREENTEMPIDFKRHGPDMPWEVAKANI